MQGEGMSRRLRFNVTRREFVVTALAAGFALAVRPVSAQRIRTGSAGLHAGQVKIPAPDGEIPAYRAMPKEGGPFPVMLVVQEIFGVHEYIRDICRRLGRLGYLAVAPELYARQGDVSKLSDTKEIFSKVVSKVPDDEVLADLDAAADWAGSTGKGDLTRLGITGFCWGGRIVWLYAAHSPRLKAGVAWYGRLDGDTSARTPRNPIHLVARMKAPVLGLYGGTDASIPVESIKKMRAALHKAGSPSQIFLYVDAPHGFHADYRPSYRKGPAEDGWRRMLIWLKKYGVVPSR
jgi:carboxymethylenebutenolidase